MYVKAVGVLPSTSYKAMGDPDVAGHSETHIATLKSIDGLKKYKYCLSASLPMPQSCALKSWGLVRMVGHPFKWHNTR